MKYEFIGQTLGGDWVTGNLIEGKRTAFIVPPHKIFSQSHWKKVDINTVRPVKEDDFEIIESKTE